MASQDFEKNDAIMIVAQISDLHLRSDGVLLKDMVDTQACLDACVAHMNGLKPRPDVALATGDLVQDPSAADYAALRQALGGLHMPVYVIPGNHDGRDNLRAAFQDQGYLPTGGAFLHYTVEDFPLRLIGLDTVIPGALGGAMCAERLAWLRARLEEQPTRPTLIFMHHPPFRTGIAPMDKAGFQGAAEMEHLIQRHAQVEWITCGHLHRVIAKRWGGTVVSTASASVFQMGLNLIPDAPLSLVMEPPGCPVFMWSEEDGIVHHTSLVGDFGPHHIFRPGE